MASYSSVGVSVRLGRMLPDGRSVVFAFDHGVEHGPSVFPEEHLDPRVILSKVVDAGVDAVMMPPGSARLTADIWSGRASLIVKVTGKTNMRPEDERLLQSPIAGVRDAVALGADGVAATVYWGSQYEDVMLERWSMIRMEAEEYGMPVLQLAYPRGPAIEDRYRVEIVMYGARAAAETGADLIKTYYTGSTESFSRVVRAASGVPVLMSGGAKASSVVEFLEKVYSVMEAGGRGVVVGRNVFQHRDPKSVIKAVMLVVHEGLEPGEAASRAGVE